MKNFKTILLSLFAIIASTEMVHPIIFTGPGRRQAHRQEKEEAYAAGVAAGSGQTSNEDAADVSVEDDGVEIQALGDGAFLTKFKNATSEERTALLAQATPEQKALLQKIKNAQAKNVKTQAMQSDDEDVSAGALAQEDVSVEEDAAVKQALQDAELYDDLQAVQIQAVATEPVVSAEPVAVLAMSAPAVQHVQAASSSVSPLLKSAPVSQPSPTVSTDTAAKKPADTAITPAVAPTMTPIAQTLATPAVPVSVAPVVVTPVTTPAIQTSAAQATPAEHSKPEQDKVVKVYPVLDAVRSAMHHIYSAAQDMVNYAYSLVSAPAKPVKESVEAEKQNPGTEKGEVKVQSYRSSQPHADY